MESKESLELKLLELEIKEKEKRKSWLERLGGNVLLIVAIITPMIGFFSNINARFAEKAKLKQEHIARFYKDLDKAASQTNVLQKSVYIKNLSSYWEDETLSENDRRMLATTLSNIIVTDTNSFIKLQAAQVIGDAITEENIGNSNNYAAKTAELLYGNGTTYKYGTITNQFQYLDTNSSSYLDQQFALRESIRFNWEYLQNCYFKNCDLHHIRLYKSDLKKSNFKECNLKYADLDSADLIGADLSDAILDSCNLYRAILDTPDINVTSKNPTIYYVPQENFYESIAKKQ